MQQCRVGEALGSILNLVPNGRDKDCVYMSLCVCVCTVCSSIYVCTCVLQCPLFVCLHDTAPTILSGARGSVHANTIFLNS